MAEPIHDVAHRSWWSGQVTTRCGQTYKPGQGESLIFASITCPACKKAKK